MNLMTVTSTGISVKNTFKGICKMAKYVCIKHLPFCDV